jgi:hypothetical protein
MNTPSVPDRAAATVAALSSIFGVILQLTGTLAGISAVAYYIGWRENSSYYSELGCAWYMPVLAASDIIQTAIPALLSVAVTSFVQFEIFVKGKATPKYLNRAALVNSSLALGLDLLLLTFPGRFTAVATHVMGFLVGGFFAFAAGFWIAELIARFVESERNWRQEHWSLLYVILMLGAWLIPDYMGRARADADSDPGYTTLAEVTLVDSKPGQRWRVIHSSDGHLLLGAFALKSADRRFRLVESKEVKEIRPEGTTGDSR